MRTDVKLGVVLAGVIVLMAGGYYAFWDNSEAPIPVADSSLADASKWPASQTGRAGDAPVRSTGRDSAARARHETSAQPGTPREQPRTNDAGSPTRHGRPLSGQPVPPRSSRTVERSSPAQTVAPQVVPTGAGSEVVSEGEERVAAGDVPRTSPRTAQPATGRAVPAMTAAREPHGATTDRGAGHGNAAPASSGPLDEGESPAGADGGKAPVTVVRRTGALPRRVGSGQDTPGRSIPVPVRSAESTAPGGVGAAAADVAVDTHKVQPGDTFSSLAKMYYGDVRHTDFLVGQNGSLGDPTRLGVGMVVRIPPLPGAAGSVTSTPSGTADALTTAGSAPSAPAGSAASQTEGATGQVSGAVADRAYTVKTGDTFYGIARDILGDASRWRELFELNEEAVRGDATRLQVGQVIRLPKS